MSGVGRRGFLAGGLGGAMALLLSREVFAASATQRKAAVLARALSYERTLADRAGGSVDILLVHTGGAGLEEAQGWTAAFESLSSVKVAGKQVSTQVAVIGPEMTTAISTGEIDVVITCGDVATAVVEELGAMTGRANVLSVGTRRSQIETALTFGVVEEDGKLQMLVNLRAAKREGVRFSSKLLKLAEVIR